MRSICLVVVLTLISGVARAGPLTFDAAERLARETAPSLEAQALDIRAAHAAAISAGRLPDPKLGLAVEGFPVSGPTAARPDLNDFSDVRVGLSQDFPNLAKRRAARARASADIDVAQSGQTVEARAVAVSTALAWVDLYYAERRLKALDDIDRAIAPIRTSAPARLASGSQRPAQSLEAEQLSAALDDQRSGLMAEVGKARAELVRWTGDPTVEVSGAPPDYPIDATSLRASLDRLPALASFDALDAQADADLAAARAEKRPDLGLEVGYQHRDPRFGDLLMTGVTISLPIFGGTRQDPMIAARAQTANRVRAQREATRRDLAAQLDADLADHTMHRDRLARAATTLVPLALKRAELERASYAAGAASLSDVLDAVLALAQARLDVIEREAVATRDSVRIALTYGSQGQ